VRRVRSPRSIGLFGLLVLAAGTFVAQGGRAGTPLPVARLPSLEPPLLVDPPEGETLANGVDYPPTETTWFFSWRPVEGATRYELFVVAPDPTLPNHDVVVEGGSGNGVCFRSYPQCHTRVGLGASIPAGALEGWRWRVRAASAEGWGAWSEERSFDVAPAADRVGDSVHLVARVAGWRGGPAGVRGVWSPALPPVVRGRIDADGDLDVTLPPLRLADSLRSTAALAPSAALQIGDGRHVVVGWWFFSDEAGLPLGVATMSTTSGRRVLAAPATARHRDAAAVWWFCDEAVVVRGSQLRGDVEYAFVLDLEAGWNLVLLTVVTGADVSLPVLIELQSIDALPSGVEWRWARGR
jgi:hypothetical protein